MSHRPFLSLLPLILLVTSCGSTREEPDADALSAIEMNLYEYENAVERERTTRTQATGEHPVAEQALRDLEAEILEDAAEGPLRERYLLAIDERLRGAAPNDPGAEALRQLRARIAP